MADGLPEEEEKGELVETGSFRVDTGRMMEVLSRYQLQSPDLAVHELVRCAVLSGAPELLLAPDEGPEGKGLWAGFEGKPLSEAELTEIFSPLLSGDAGRGRHLAAALLALLGTKPSRLTLASGGRKVELAGAQGAAIRPSEHKRTVLRVLWAQEPQGLSIARVLSFPAACSGALACCPIAVRSGADVSEPFSAADREGEELRFEAGGRRGLVSPRFEDAASPVTGEVPAPVSAIALHVAGVYAETVELGTPPAPVSVDMEDDALRLDASFAKCVRDDNFEAASAFAQGKVMKLLQKSAHRQRSDLQEVGRLMKLRRYRALWRARMSGAPDWRSAAQPGLFGPLSDLWKSFAAGEPGPVFDGYFGEPNPENLALIAHAGPRTLWLQDACRRAIKRRVRPSDPELDFLWKTPVLLSCAGEPLSLSDIQEMQRGSRKLLYSTAFAGLRGFYEGPPGSDVVWISCERDKEFLSAYIPWGRRSMAG